MSIGDTLKRARSEAKLTQEAAAEKIGVSRQTLSSWENGRSYPDIASVIALSDAYNVPLDSLLKGDTALIKHLKESTDVTIKVKQIIPLLVALTLFLLSTIFPIVSVGGYLQNFTDLATFLFIIAPLTCVLAVTRSFKTFGNGLLAAFFPSKEMTKEFYERAAALFRLLSKTAAMAVAFQVIIGFLNLLMSLDISNPDAIVFFLGNCARLLFLPLYGLLLMLFVFEPVAYILTHKNQQETPKA